MCLVQQHCHKIRRESDADRISFQLRAIARDNGPSGAISLQRLRARVETNVCLDLLRKRVDQNLHSLIERQEQTVTSAARSNLLRPALPQHREYQTAMLTFNL